MADVDRFREILAQKREEWFRAMDRMVNDPPPTESEKRAAFDRTVGATLRNLEPDRGTSLEADLSLAERQSDWIAGLAAELSVKIPNAVNVYQIRAIIQHHVDIGFPSEESSDV